MKRAKGEGMIREYKPGKWLARITIDGKTKDFYGKSKLEVSAKLREYRQKLDAGLSGGKAALHSDFLETWLEMKRGKLRPQSYYRLESTVNVHLVPGIGYYRLDRLNDMIIEDDLFRPSAKLSYSSRKKIYDAVNASLKYAVRRGFIARNPVDLLQPPAKTETEIDDEGEVETLTVEEVAAFVKAAQAKYKSGAPVYRNGNLFLMMLNTGMRIGEACALKWTDYDEGAGTITVRSSVIRDKDESGKGIVREQSAVKTRLSKRTLKHNANAIAALPEKRVGKLIYCTMDGKPLRYRNIQNALDSILKRAGIPHKSTHIFRHTFASRLFEKGYDVRIVSELLGHTNVNTTYNTYIHIIKKQKAKAMEAIEDMY